MHRSGKDKFLGFTLIEILVVIAIIGILVSIGMYGYNIALMNSRDQQRKANVNSIANALEQFYTDHNSYPSMATNGNSIDFNASYQLDQSNQAGCISSAPNTPDSLVPNYISSIPQDPSSQPNPCSYGTQDKQYLYTAVIQDGSTAGSPQSFGLMAYMEKTTDQSTSDKTAIKGSYYYTGAFNLALISGSSNYFIGPVAGD